MSITKQQVIERFLPDTPLPGTTADAFAPSNIALCKYWGKRDAELNLPINASLSVSLGELGSRTSITPVDADSDQVFLNGELLAADSSFARKVIRFVDLFRRDLRQPLSIRTENNIPTAAGLASSASGFAALMLALDQFYQLGLEPARLSAFARMGSGSASRSIFDGFVEWHKGSREDGMDSCAERLDIEWPGFRIGLLKVATGVKKLIRVPACSARLSRRHFMHPGRSRPGGIWRPSNGRWLIGILNCSALRQSRMRCRCMRR